MGTFLTNDKMTAALRERIEASVLGRTRGPRTRITPTMRAVIRFAVLLAAVAGLVAAVVQWRQGRRALEAAQAALIADVAELVAPLAHGREPLLAGARRWLAGAAGDYEGDVVLRGSLDALLARSATYVRGPIDAFRSEARFDQTLGESLNDALAYCLFDPPASEAEQHLRVKVDNANRSGTLPNHVFRLIDAGAAEPYADASWAARVRAASSVGEVDTLRKRVERAKLDRAVRAAQAEILIYVLDEPKKPGTPSEFDGASDHFVRVGVVDATNGTTLLRVRKRTDPSWISERMRHLALGLCNCKLALQIRLELEAGNAGG
jgi:hypothetical protein